MSEMRFERPELQFGPLPEAINEWLGAPRELGVDVLERAKKEIWQTGNPDLWPGQAELLSDLLDRSAYLHKADALIFINHDGEVEPVGRLTLAHQLRSGLMAHELANAYGLDPLAAAEIFDAVWLHDTGKFQLEMFNPGILSEKSVFRKSQREFIYTHDVLGEDLLNDLSLPSAAAANYQLIKVVARYHHAFHPRRVANNETALPESIKRDHRIMFALKAAALADTSDATRWRSYINDSSKIMDRFPVAGSSEAIVAWSKKMLVLPADLGQQEHEELEGLIQKFCQLVSTPGTITNHLLNAA